MQDHISCYLNGKSVTAGSSVMEGRTKSLYPVRIYTNTLVLHLQKRDLPSLEKAVGELKELKTEYDTAGATGG